MVQQGPRTLRNIIGAALKRLARRIDPTPSPDIDERDFLDEMPLGREVSTNTRMRIHRQSQAFHRSLGDVSGIKDALKRQEVKPPEKTPDVNVQLIKPGISPQETPEPDVRTSNTPFKHVTELHHLESAANADGWFSSPNAYNARNLYRELPKLRSLLKSTDDLSEVLSIGNRYSVFKPKDSPLIKKLIESELNPHGRLHVLPHAVLAGLKIGAFTKNDGPYLEKIANHLYQANEFALTATVLMHGLNYGVFDEAHTRSAFEHLLNVSPRFGYSVVSQVARHGVNCGVLDARHESTLYNLAKNATTDKNGPWPLRAAELLRLSHYVSHANEKTTPLYLSAARVALERNMPRELEGISDIISTAKVNVNLAPKSIKSFNRTLSDLDRLKNGRQYLAGLRFAAIHNLLPRPTVKARLLDFISEIKESKEPNWHSLHLPNAAVTLFQLKMINEKEYNTMLREFTEVNSQPDKRKEFYNPTEQKASKPVVRRRKNRALK